jgi:hypothetical protein
MSPIGNTLIHDDFIYALWHPLLPGASYTIFIDFVETLMKLQLAPGYHYNEQV